MNYLEAIDFHQPDFGDLYDELPLWSAPFGLHLLDRVPVRAGSTILDVGAGTGFLTLELAQRCGPESRVIAVDPWSVGLDRLRRKLAHVGLRNVVLLERDAATIDLPAASVDVIVSNLGINNFENAAAVLRTCFRVAKPGAKLLLTTNVIGHMAEFYEVFRATLIELGQTDRLSDLEAHIAHRGTADSVADLLRESGFTLQRLTTDSFRMRFANGTALLQHYFIRLGFVQGWKAVVEPDLARATFTRLERNLDAVAADQGELALTIPLLVVEACKESG
jgi:ubiquinone/menaquinone biosynthesis C-methylase UbiE